MSSHISVVGTIATEPKEITLPSGIPLCTFRLASSERRFNAEAQKWEDSQTNWFTVNVFRALATNALASFEKGQRVLVNGKLRVKSWEHEQRSGTSVEIDAESLGHELRWGTSVFKRAQPPASEPRAEDQVNSGEGGVEEPPAQPAAGADDGGWANPATSLHTDSSVATPF